MQEAFTSGIEAEVTYVLKLIVTVALSLAGFLLSLYAYLIERKIAQNPSYKPYCDISDRVSCSKVVTSPYANLFFVSNAIIGMCFYVLVVLLAILHYYQLLLATTALGVISSMCLAYILYAKIKSLCLICTTLYMVNVALFVCTIVL